MRDMENSRFCDYMGKAAEHAVAAQLLMRQSVPHWPAVDLGYDLLTEKMCRVQIKSSHIDGNTRGGIPYYWFPLAKTRLTIRKNQAVRVPVAEISKICDVVVFWGIEENQFWVVPSSLVICQGVALGPPDPKRFFGSLKDMREMHALGYSNYKIGKHYGIDRQSVQQFLDSGKEEISETISSQLRACEGRWENILDFIPAAVVTPAQIEKE
jgi:hypothetical protein